MTREILLLLSGAAIGAVLLWVIVRRRPPGREDEQHQMASLHQLLSERLDRVTDQLDRRLQENVRAMNESKSFLANRVSTAERAVREVSVNLGKLEQATAALQRTSQEITSFQQLLKNPKVRGSFGEVLLGNLLAEMLPHDRFELQYTFRDSGEIADAVVKLQDDHIVAVDAKFPLANYEALAQADSQAVRQARRREFVRDVKKHVADIARKYINPKEGTLNYAFMYVPIESVYYETIVHEGDGSVWEYCRQHNVFPVSPNSFAGYLSTVAVGLRGLKVEEQAREILRYLSQLRQDFIKFADEFSTVGTHLANAKNRYDDSARRLDKFANRLEQIESTEAPQLAEPADKPVAIKKEPARVREG